MNANIKLNLTPFLAVTDALGGAAAFYEAAFGATILKKNIPMMVE